MTTHEAARLFSFGSWANARFFDAAAAMTPEQQQTALAASFPSVLGTLGHIAGAEWVWWRRWLGESPTAMPVWATETDLTSIRTRLAQVEAGRDVWLSHLGDDDLSRVVSYRSLSGMPCANSVADMIRHVVNHSTYHRGQLVSQFRQLGLVPPSTDYILFVRESA